MEVSGQLHAPTALFRGKNPGTHLMGGWKRPKADLDFEKQEKFLPLLGFGYRIIQSLVQKLY
jgi:hypothetical protein